MFRLLLVTSCLAACGRLGFDGEVMPDACAVLITAPSSRTNVHSYVTFAATGGRPPYEFRVVSGPGAIDVDGKFASADQTGTATIEVRDAFGCTAQTTLEVGGTSLFYVGGTSMSVPTDQVLRSDDGITWTVVGNLLAARYSGALLVMRDTMFYVSGSGATVARDVYASRDGVTWIRVGDVPVGATSFGAVVFRGQLWMVGGNGNGRATRSSYDGATWTDAGDLPEDNHGGSLAVLDDALVYTGGHNGSLYDWVVTSPDGDTWTDAANLPTGREYHRSITVGDTLVLVGGQTTTPTALALVTTTTDAATFQAMPDLPTARANTGLAWFRDALWSVGGSDGNGVYSAPMAGSWTSHATNFPVPRTSGGLVAFTPR